MTAEIVSHTDVAELVSEALDVLSSAEAIFDAEFGELNERAIGALYLLRQARDLIERANEVSQQAELATAG